MEDSVMSQCMRQNGKTPQMAYGLESEYQPVFSTVDGQYHVFSNVKKNEGPPR